MSQSDFHAPVVPGPAQGLQRFGGAQQAPLPPSLGGPPQLGPVGDPTQFGMDPSQGGMGQPNPLMMQPQGAQQLPMGGGVQPPMAPQGPMGAENPGAQSPQAGQIPTTSQGGVDNGQGDELDQYVNWQAQRLMSQQGDPGAQQHLGFLQTLKGAKDRDPEGFYMILSALATGDPHNVLQVAAHLRQTRMAQQQATQQQLMSVARERDQRRDVDRQRVEDRTERQGFQRDMKQEAALRSYVDKLSGKGLLDRVEKKLGHPIQTLDDMRAAQVEESKLNASDKVVKQSGDYVGALMKGPQPMAGLIKAHYEADPNFKSVVDEANARREEMDALKKENLKARTERSKRVAATVARVDPAMKIMISNLQRQLKEAEDDEDAAQRELDANTFMTKADTEDTMGYRSLSASLQDRLQKARDKADSYTDQLNDAMATIGAPSHAGPKRPKDLDGDGLADVDEDGNEYATDENGVSTGPRVDTSTPKPGGAKKSIDWSKIDSKLGP